MLAEKYDYAEREKFEVKMADELLEVWYEYSKNWRPNLGISNVVVYCKQFCSSRQYDDISSIAEGAISQAQLDEVEWCVNELPISYQTCIQRKMRERDLNHKSHAKVWRCDTSIDYRSVLEKIVPLMRQRCLFD